MNAKNLEVNPGALDALLNERDVAQLTGLSLATVRRWRHLRIGPRYLKISSNAVRYRPEDLKAWIESRPSAGGQVEMK